MRKQYYLHTNVEFTHPSISDEQDWEPTPQTQVFHMFESNSHADVFAYAEQLLSHGFINSYHIECKVS